MKSENEEQIERQQTLERSIERFGVSKKAFAWQLGVTPDCVSKWIKRDRKISKTAFLLMQELLKNEGYKVESFEVEK